MVDDLSPFEALEQAVERVGSQAELARICKVSPTAVWKWLQSTKRLPAELVLEVERVTGISRHRLRPDIYPRGLVDGVPYNAEEPLLDMFSPIALPNRQPAASRDVCNQRFQGVDRRAGAQL